MSVRRVLQGIRYFHTVILGLDWWAGLKEEIEVIALEDLPDGGQIPRYGITTWGII